METIWYVYKLFGGAPSFRHASYESAITEAKRLIDTVGGEYEILRLESVVKPAPKHVVELAVETIRWRPNLSDDGVPF